MLNFNNFKEMIIESARNENEINSILEELNEYVDSEEFQSIKEADGTSDIGTNIVGKLKIEATKGKLEKAYKATELENINYAKIKKHAHGNQEDTVAKAKHDAIINSIKKKEDAITKKIDAIATTTYLKDVAASVKADATEDALQSIIQKVDDDDKERYKDKLDKTKETASRHEDGISKWEDDNKDEVKEMKDLIAAANKVVKNKEAEMASAIKQARKDGKSEDEIQEITDNYNEQIKEITDAINNADKDELKKYKANPTPSNS